MSHKYTSEQISAIQDNIFGTTRIVACAGSGKTECMAERIAYIAKTTGVAPEMIWATTFSNKATSELKERISKKFDGGKNVTVTNIHKAASSLLREFSVTFPGVDGVPSSPINIITPAVIPTILRKLAAELPEDLDNSLSLSVKDIAKQVTQWKMQSVSYHLAEECSDEYTAELYKRYVTYTRCNQLFDFDDLILRCIALLKEHAELRSFTQSKVSFMLVDEYQDVCPHQEELLELIRGDAPFTCVGDDDQSIYAFRGADFRHFTSFLDRYPDAKDIHLTTNFRSNDKIIKAASALVSERSLIQKSRHSQKFGAFAIKGTHSPVRTLPNLADDEEEAERIAHEIKAITSLVDESTRASYGSIAILYRTHSQASLIEHELVKSGIPCTLRGRINFWESKVAKTALALLSLTQTSTYPNFYQVASNFAGVGEKTIQSCFSKDVNCIDALTVANSLAGNTIKEALELFNSTCETDFIDAAIRLIKNPSLYGDIFANEQDFDKNMSVLNTIEETLRLLKDVHSMDSLLDELYLNRDASVSGDAVQLMTIHAAKGLQWSVVFMAGVVNGVFPSRQGDANFEEEYRLAYVGMTRAKNLLYLCGRKKRKSTFIESIPSHLKFDATTPPGSIYGGFSGKASAQSLVDAMEELNSSLFKSLRFTNQGRFMSTIISLRERLSRCKREIGFLDSLGLSFDDKSFLFCLATGMNSDLIGDNLEIHPADIFGLGKLPNIKQPYMNYAIH